jgi:hypothetical protein
VIWGQLDSIEDRRLLRSMTARRGENTGRTLWCEALLT